MTCDPAPCHLAFASSSTATYRQIGTFLVATRAATDPHQRTSTPVKIGLNADPPGGFENFPTHNANWLKEIGRRERSRPPRVAGAISIRSDGCGSAMRPLRIGENLAKLFWRGLFAADTAVTNRREAQENRDALQPVRARRQHIYASKVEYGVTAHV